MEKPTTEADLSRARFRREDRRDALPATVLSIAVHGALFAGLFSAFHWNTAPEAVYAELWAPEEVSGGNDPSGVAEKTPEERTEPAPAEEAAPEPEPEKAAEPAPRSETEPEPEPAAPTSEEIAAQEAAEAQRLEEERIARAAQEELEARRREAERIAQERARAEEIERMREEAIEAERRKAVEEQKRLEEERIARERLEEEARRAEETRKAEEARRAEEARLAEEQRKAEALRIAEELRRAEAQRARELAEAEAARKAAEREAAEAKARAEEKEKQRKAEIARQMRQRELARLLPKTDPNAQRSGTPGGDQRNQRRVLMGTALATWSGKVRACVRQNITIDVPANTPKGRFQTEYRLKLLPTGEQAGAPVLVRPSGWSAYDAAVERAIRRCNPLPREPGYQMPGEIRLVFDPVEDKS